MSSLEFRCRHQYSDGFKLDVEFTAPRRVTALFGPSGSGKTTVLSLVAGFLKPARGLIRQTDPQRVLTDTAQGIFLPPDRRGVGFVFQEHRLFPHLNVERNLRYGEARPGRRSGVDLGRVIEVLELGGLLRQFPRQLSGGESQRVALGRALLSGPDLLLLDEPLAALDEPLKQRILGYLERVLAEWRIPVLFVSHSQADVRRLADWVVVIRDGRLVAQGTPDDALGQPELLGWTDAIGPANLLRLEHVEQQPERWQGRIGSQILSIPPLPAAVRGPLYVQFLPRDVIVCLHDVTGVSARNHLRGTVRQIVETPSGVFVAVDVGQMLWAELTPAAVTELQLSAGSEVLCLIKTQSLKIVE